ncbi:MAG: hypothetical protein A2X12_09200 [Bacteroidetes bacterium GWE2_29_8]|nr:MAG: hypothetical protein A2X12_09200 [Bacteroidetes bacterium GWE2_29_8]
MNKHIVLIFILFTHFFSYSQNRIITIASYNVENIFDTINQPNNDDEFTPDGKNKWTQKRYNKKINDIAYVISEIGKELSNKAPDIIGLCEVENRTVVKDIIATETLKKYNYQILHFDSPDKRGVDVAMIYNPLIFKLINCIPITLTIPEKKDFYTRDMLLATGNIESQTFHFIICHWPSRRGGEKKSKTLRIAAAQLCKKTVDSLITINPNANIVIMGDFNDNPDNESIYKFLNAKKDSIKLKPNELYNTSFGIYEQGVGSLAYQDTWSLFDQIIINQNLINNDSGYKYLKTKIFNQSFLQQKEGRFKGYPWRTYIGRNYSGGYSDHFPAYMFLAK